MIMTVASPSKTNSYRAAGPAQSRRGLTAWLELRLLEASPRIAVACYRNTTF
jgi:hypothetical protein